MIGCMVNKAEREKLNLTLPKGLKQEAKWVFDRENVSLSQAVTDFFKRVVAFNSLEPVSKSVCLFNIQTFALYYGPALSYDDFEFSTNEAAQKFVKAKMSNYQKQFHGKLLVNHNYAGDIISFSLMYEDDPEMDQVMISVQEKLVNS